MNFETNYALRQQIEREREGGGGGGGMVERCFTSTETVGLLGTGAQDGHLHFHTAPELWGGMQRADRQIETDRQAGK